jgi:uncharacterized protein
MYCLPKQGTITVRVSTGKRATKVIGFDPEKKYWKIELAAKPVEGEANKELVKFLSKLLSRQVRIVKGLKSREKILTIK